VAFVTNFKPSPGSGRAERRARKLAARRGLEPDTHAQTLERIEFWRVLRLELFARYSGKCFACAVALDLDAGLASNAMHAHHLIHKSAGGLDVLDNLIALCARCHRKHHDGLLTMTGTWNALAFVLRNLKGQVVKAWESVLAA
jgi:5-methylcytosine-specific restriction endonuclease McrA